jgi:hypothetical protein
MDLTRLGRGELIAGVSGILLIVFMFALDWFGVSYAVGVVALPSEVTGDAWYSYDFTAIVLFVSAVAGIVLALSAIGLALLGGSARKTPTIAGSIVAGLGMLSVILVVISIISPPNLAPGDLSGPGIDQTRKLGVWLGLAAAAGIALGGSMTVQEREAASGPPSP